MLQAIANRFAAPQNVNAVQKTAQKFENKRHRKSLWLKFLRVNRTYTPFRLKRLRKNGAGVISRSLRWLMRG
jgi:hypothetical protein